MKQETFQLIKELTELPGISGDEGRVRDYLAKKMTPYVDKLEQSGLGNIFGIKYSLDQQAPRVLVAAHMDEVGFMVKRIMDNGNLRVQAIGGWNVYAMVGQRYRLITRQGDYPCVSAAVPPHLLRGKEAISLKAEDIVFDAGFISKEEAEEYGVRPGDSIVPEAETVQTANGQRIMGKAWDNRYGCVVVLEVVEALADQDLPYCLIAGATVQEELGLRGIKGAVNRYKPDLVIVVDCSPAGDSDGDQEALGQLDQGFLLRIQDPGMITHPGFLHYIEDLAQAHQIKYQPFFSQGGTDAGAAHQLQEGIPACVIGVPARYIHGHQAVYSINDYQAAKDVLVSLLSNLNPALIDKIKNN